MADMTVLRDLLNRRYNCAQAILSAGLSARGEENEGLVRAAAGLGSGLGGCGRNCGALTGAVCLLGLYAGWESPEETDSTLNLMAEELVNWFEEKYGSVECEDITKHRQSLKATLCPKLTEDTYGKTMEILENYGFVVPEEAW